MAKNNGGLAFPRAGDASCFAENGMWLRDWFAGQALKVTLLKSFSESISSLEIDVARAYRIADIMIAERDK